MPITTALATDAGKQLTTADTFGRKLVMQVYPATYSGVVYVDYDNAAVDSSHYGFLLRAGDLYIDEPHGSPQQRANAAKIYFKVSVDGGGFSWVIEP